MGLYPGLAALNIMGRHAPQSAVLSAIIYNALIIIALIPLALKGVKYREVPAGKLLSHNLLIYGLGGLVAPFVFIKLIDMILVLFGLAYASKKYNELLPMYHIKRSMSRAGTPTDNGAMEAINGWIKAELFTDFHIKGDKPIAEEIDEYIKFFNEERPAYALNYLTPRQYKEIYSTV